MPAVCEYSKVNFAALPLYLVFFENVNSIEGQLPFVPVVSANVRFVAQRAATDRFGS